MEDIQVVFSALTVLGFGGIISLLLSHLLEKRKERLLHSNELKRKRYQCIVVLMLTKIDPENGLKHVALLRPDLRTLHDIGKELEVELLNSFLYASDSVIKHLTKFIVKPELKTYINVVKAMRNDLWQNKSRVTDEYIKLIIDNDKLTGKS